MAVLKTITQRLFGRTVIDSLDLNQNAWYIDEEQVTVTAANLNGASVLPATLAVVDLTNDDILFLDHSASHIIGYDSIPDFMTLVAGTAATSALTATTGVLKVDIHSVTADTPASGDLLIFSDEGTAGDPNKTITVDNYATFLAGDGLIATAGVIETADFGTPAVGSVLFTGVGDCDAVQVGAVLYTRAPVPVVTNGEWTEGAGAAASATNLAAGINGDTRNAGGTYYTAIANTDTVHIFSKTVGGDVAIALTGGAPTEPSALEALTGGVAEAAKQSVVVSHTVTANDVDTAVLVHIPLPIVPRAYIVQIRNATGGLRYDVTDQFTVGATPNRIVLTANGATHVVAGDIITVYAQE